MKVKVNTQDTKVGNQRAKERDSCPIRGREGNIPSLFNRNENINIEYIPRLQNNKTVKTPLLLPGRGWRGCRRRGGGAGEVARRRCVF